MYTIIYEAIPARGISTPFLIVCIMTIFIAVLLIYHWKRMDIGARCFVSFIIAFLLYIIGCQIYVAIDAKDKVFEEYLAGNYYTVEGPIQEYILAEEGQPNLPDRFFVNELRFSVPGFVSAWGYPLKQVDGGILQEGMTVRICYIPYKYENVIMKLEVIE